MGMVNINGQMADNTQAIGLIIKCMEKVYLLGKMVECIKEITSMIKKKGMEYSLGQMAVNIMDNG
jgi:hypothetical protein